MVAMASRGSARTLLRVGSRIAGRSRPTGSPSMSRRRRRNRADQAGRSRGAADNIRFAKQLGAKVVKLKGSRVADALVEFASAKGITHVIFGQSARSRWDLLSTARSSIASSATCAMRPCRSCLAEAEAATTMRR
jgi:two-component system sensor histidine kinase KdpD